MCAVVRAYVSRGEGLGPPVRRWGLLEHEEGAVSP